MAVDKRKKTIFIIIFICIRTVAWVCVLIMLTVEWEIAREK
jgi:hypothetical protein